MNEAEFLEKYQMLSNSECRARIFSSQTVGDKVHGQKGNSPDHQIRSQNLRQVEKDVETRKQLGG